MKTQWLALVVGLQTLWVISTVITQESRLRRGEVVRMETVPVDPRDLLRGDYVILSYKISTLNPGLFQARPTASPAAGTPVFVQLERRGDFYEAAAASLEPITPEPGRPVLKGRVSVRPGQERGAEDPIRVEYGLERYYVREGTGNPSGKLTVDVAVPASGNGAIKQVYVDGIPYPEAAARQKSTTGQSR